MPPELPLLCVELDGVVLGTVLEGVVLDGVVLGTVLDGVLGTVLDGVVGTLSGVLSAVELFVACGALDGAVEASPQASNDISIAKQIKITNSLFIYLSLSKSDIFLYP